MKNFIVVVKSGYVRDAQVYCKDSASVADIQMEDIGWMDIKSNIILDTCTAGSATEAILKVSSKFEICPDNLDAFETVSMAAIW